MLEYDSKLIKSHLTKGAMSSGVLFFAANLGQFLKDNGKGISIDQQVK